MAARRGNLHSLGAAAVVLAIMIVAAAAAPPLPPPSPSGSEGLVLRHIGVIPSPTPTPIHRPKIEDDEPERPLPRSWVIAGAIAAALALVGITYGATRVWRSSNLFDRQYRFPRAEEVAVRLGGEKSGGHMATVSFAADQSRAVSKAKDA